MSDSTPRSFTAPIPAGGGVNAAVPLKVVVVAGVDEGLEAPLESTIEVGSDVSCGLVLRDPAVSRKHLVIGRVASRLMVKDRNSRNGTFLGGARVMNVEVPVGAVLRIGNSSIAIQPRWYVREVSPSAERSFGELIGESVAMREVFAMLERIAPTDVTLLIEGESGTGKDVAARSLHARSHRAEAPYIVFDCSSVPQDLAESELFGHRRGAFSGAVSDRAGAFLAADGGTIFLDEIGELPPELQPKLLRVLEAGEVRSVGDDAVRKVDVRVVAATNRDLHAETQRGRFRADLLYRLEVVRVRMPPLRHRPEDIPMLVGHFLTGKLPAGDAIGGDNLARLIGYAWPGNVRELRNTLARAVALAQRPGGPPAPFAKLIFNLAPSARAPSTFGMQYPGVAPPLPYKEAKEQLVAGFDRAYVEALLARHGGNMTKAAAEAGLSRKHLYELVRRTEGSE